MDFEEFEGFKRIKNVKDLKIEKIFEVLENYHSKIGELKIENEQIIADIDGKYYIKVSIQEDDILIERILEDGKVSDENNNFLDLPKGLPLVQADRMIEQVYDLINDYMQDGIVEEHITSANKILFMEENEKIVLGGAFSLGKKFEIIDENRKLLYEASQNYLTKVYAVRDLKMKREICSVNYNDAENDKYLILKNPFEKIIVSKNNSATKNIFEGTFSKNKLKISSDYSDNHYLVEVNEIVVGAIDCMDPLIKKEYRLEINNLDYEYLIICVAVITDIFNSRHNQGII